MARGGSRKHRRHSRKHRGGTNAPSPSSYSSGAGYGMAVNGSGDSQFARVFDQSGADGPYQSNTIIGVQGQNLGPNSITQKAGRRKKGKKGGFFGPVINQALVPFTILGMQQTYGRKKRGGKGTKKHHRHHRRSIA